MTLGCFSEIDNSAAIFSRITELYLSLGHIHKYAYSRKQLVVVRQIRHLSAEYMKMSEWDVALIAATPFDRMTDRIRNKKRYKTIMNCSRRVFAEEIDAITFSNYA